jgi:hypothetical protein
MNDYHLSHQKSCHRILRNVNRGCCFHY